MEFNIIIIILSTSALMFMLYQLWFFYENYDYIVEFNRTYRHLEYVRGPNLLYNDTTIYDPNNSVNMDERFRCKYKNGKYFSVSKKGFISEDSNSLTLSWSDLKECIYYTFSNNVVIVYDACTLDPESDDCKLLKELLKNNEDLREINIY